MKERAGEDEGMVTRSEEDREEEAQRERARATDFKERLRTCEDEGSSERRGGTMREQKKKATEAALGLKGGDVTSD